MSDSIRTSDGIPTSTRPRSPARGETASRSTVRQLEDASLSHCSVRLPESVNDEVATYDSTLPQTSLIATTQRIDRGWRRIGLSAARRYPDSILLAGARRHVSSQGAA